MRFSGVKSFGCRPDYNKILYNFNRLNKTKKNGIRLCPLGPGPGIFRFVNGKPDTAGGIADGIIYNNLNVNDISDGCLVYEKQITLCAIGGMAFIRSRQFKGIGWLYGIYCTASRKFSGSRPHFFIWS